MVPETRRRGMLTPPRAGCMGWGTAALYAGGGAKSRETVDTRSGGPLQSAATTRGALTSGAEGA